MIVNAMKIRSSIAFSMSEARSLGRATQARRALLTVGLLTLSVKVVTKLEQEIVVTPRRVMVAD